VQSQCYISLISHTKNVYHALVHSYLRYGILVWRHATKSVLKPLEILANKAIRIMTFAPFGNIDLKSVYQELKLIGLV
jgi:hypothetical protein